MVGKLFVILPLLLMSFLGSSQVDFSASVQAPSDVNTDSPLRLIIKSNKAGDFKPPAFKDFNAELVQQYSSLEFVVENNRRISQTIFYLVYQLMPKKAGKLVIESASLNLPDKKYYTAPITIEVSQGKKPKYSNGEIDPEADVVARMIPSKRNIYKGESFTVTYKIYSPHNFRQLAGFETETYEGFNKHSLIVGSGKKTNYDIEFETINGKRYQVITLERELLVSNKSGNYTLDPFNVKVVIANRRGRAAVKEAKSAPITIKVKDLPKTGRPDDFTGAVGKFEITAEASSHLLTEDDDGFDLKINISGKGNVDFDDPNIELINEFDTYPPESDEDKKISSSGVTVKRFYNYFTVPLQNGEFELGPFSFTYFDPELGQYKTAATEPIKITVNNPNIKAERIAGDKKNDIEAKTKELRFIITDTELENKDEFLAGTTKYWLGLGTPALLFFLLVFVKRRQKDEDPEAQINKRALKAGKIAKQRLNKAAAFISANEHGAFYDENLRALYAYLSEKIHMQAHDMSKQNIREQLQELAVSENTSQQFVSILESCEMARYAAFSQNANEIYAQSVDVIMNVEKEIKAS